MLLIQEWENLFNMHCSFCEHTQFVQNLLRRRGVGFVIWQNKFSQTAPAVSTFVVSSVPYTRHYAGEVLKERVLN